MASNVYSTFFGISHGCHQSNPRLSYRFSRFLPVSGKMRPRNFRRQQIKKIPPERQPVDVQPSGDGSPAVEIPVTDIVSKFHQETESNAGSPAVEIPVTDIVSNFHQETESNAEINNDSNGADFDGLTLLEETKSLVSFFNPMLQE